MPKKIEPKLSNLIDLINRYEIGALDEEETIGLFQYLIDTDLAWSLQGSYGRHAMRLIDSGKCHHKTKKGV
jgi:hypothetical protein